MLRRASVLGVLIAVVLGVSSSSAWPAREPRRPQLSLYDQALLAHTKLEPVLQAKRFMAGDASAFDTTSTRSSTTAAPAAAAATISQNGTCDAPEANVNDTRTL